MLAVKIGKELKEKRPGMALGVILCEVSNTRRDERLWEEIEQVCQRIRQEYTLENIKHQPNIAATRELYKACGKDPNRYRPAADSLYRRIVKGMDLYQISTLVDVVNLISMETGYSIGGFDASLIEWPVVAGIGKKDEAYEGIGRGPLNIENLPVLRDQKGAIGTPTSDEVRTAIRPSTHQFFMNINGYNGPEALETILDWSEKLLVKHVSATRLQKQIIR